MHAASGGMAGDRGGINRDGRETSEEGERMMAKGLPVFGLCYGSNGTVEEALCPKQYPFSSPKELICM